ncbi:TniQ family protein [Cytobacillus kochii]|uniref:TniQ family protein n=1 Tax=Cytobacillus kochii TaxID=859143 RepID=UPI0027897714|nr:TniQ family protein [Cytobacillus kochii]MDQ0186944.1 DNA-binding XRE family transcriptional regulator [Cytobacillus kochii]
MFNDFMEIEEVHLKKTILYNVEPIQLGNFHCESFTSYLTRIASLHQLKFGELVNKIIAPSLNKEYICNSAERGGNRFYDGARVLNGLSSTTYDFVCTLESLTSRSNLSHLTMLKWEKVFPSRELLRGKLAWCPKCIKEFENQYGLVFMPLLWFLKPVTCCLIHNIKLSTLCGSCNKALPILHRNMRNGYCPYCNESLALVKILELSKETIYKELFIAENLGEIITLNNTTGIMLERDVIKNRLNQIIIEFNENKSKLGTQFGIPKVTFYNWTRGDSIPTLGNLLNMCYHLNFKLKDFLLNTELLPESKCFFGAKKHKPKVTRRRLDYKKIESDMLMLLKVNTPISMEEVAAKIGVNKRLLYKNLPILSKKISRRYQQYTKIRSEERKKVVISLIEDGVKQLNLNGVLPTQKSIEKHLSLACLLREEFAKKYLSEIIENLK